MNLGTLSLLLIAALLASGCATPRATGDLGVVVERANGSLVVVDTSERTRIAAVPGLGDLSHASVVFSRDQRYAYVFGRDGGLTQVDLSRSKIKRRVVQSGNSIGGAISQDGRLVAVSNYDPGGVKVFDTRTLEPVADIPATRLASGERAKVVGLVDAPGQRFVFSLFDGNEIWIVDFTSPDQPAIQKIKDVGARPYDALITPDGRYYIAGLFGEDGLALVDLWHPERGARRILDGYGRGEEKLPVYKMPHLEGWAMAVNHAFVPAVGRREVLVVERDTWQEAGRVKVHGQPVFVMARPDQRQVWVSFAHPDNDVVQVIDTESLQIIDTIEAGQAVLHMEFTPRGEHVWISARDDNRVRVYDTRTREVIAEIAADAPSGIFFSARAHRVGL